MITNRTVTQFITKLEPDEIFVFGSNEAGRHGAGAALIAKQRFGAKSGKGVGLAGQTYAIPTKNAKLKVLPLSEISNYVNEFIQFAKSTPELTYYVTEIGCGLAGYTPKDIAPLFADAIDVKNIRLPASFWAVLMI